MGTDKDRPIDVGYDGDGGKPYRPCLTMRRVLVAVWGKEGADYVGRKMTLFRDETVRYGGLEVAGIRISHMSHITRPVTLALTATRNNKKPYTVQPLIEVAPDPPKQAKGMTTREWLAQLKSNLDATHTRQEVTEILTSEETQTRRSFLKNGALELFDKIRSEALARFVEEPPPPDDPFEEAVQLASEP